MFAVSPCPFALIKHLEHERRQITASHTGVLVHFHLSGDPRATLPVFHRTGCDMGAVTPGALGGRASCGYEQGGLLSLAVCPSEHIVLKLTQLTLDFAVTFSLKARPDTSSISSLDD